MRHLHAGRKLGVGADHRRAMIRSLMLALIEQDAIRTTPSRAKAIRGNADRIVTFAKRGDVHGRRLIVQMLGSTETHIPGQNRIRMAVDRVYSELVPRFKDRSGGYTQMFRFAMRRPGDNAEMCLFRYLPSTDEDKKTKIPVKVKKSFGKNASSSDKSKKNTKKIVSEDIKSSEIKKKDK